MKKVVRLTESDLVRIVNRVLLHENMTTSNCDGEEYTSDLCSPGNPGETNEKVWNISIEISNACECFDDSSLSDWDEIGFANALSKISDRKTFYDVVSVVSCFMRSANMDGRLSEKVSKSPLTQLTKIMMGNFDGAEKQRVTSIIKRFA
jgi:hypothetical protein